MVNVSWNDANAFCEWMTRREKAVYRLPTEAEWEYACRAGTTTLFYSGNDPEGLTAIANVADATLKQKFSNWSTLGGRDGFAFTAPVGSFHPNGFGLCDMHGNVWEWCHDWYATGPLRQISGERSAGPLTRLGAGLPRRKLVQRAGLVPLDVPLLGRANLSRLLPRLPGCGDTTGPLAQSPIRAPVSRGDGHFFSRNQVSSSLSLNNFCTDISRFFWFFCGVKKGKPPQKNRATPNRPLTLAA